MTSRISGKDAHQIRQYLTAITGGIELAKEFIKQGKRGKEVLRPLCIALAETKKLSTYITAYVQEGE